MTTSTSKVEQSGASSGGLQSDSKRVVLPSPVLKNSARDELVGTHSAESPTAWPSEITETLDACPACDSGSISILHSAVEDRVFGSPGTWTIWQCHDCGVSFLNPRLTPAAIGGAYVSYYTHVVPPKRTLRNRLRDFVVDAYAKNHLGRSSAVHLRWSDWVVRWRLPTVAESLRWTYRYLPRAWAGATLLDVGCGNGDFLRQVQAVGWDAIGLESDPQSYSIASARKLNVMRGSVPDTGLPDNSFDAVTLNHVIEHVHDPRSVMR